MITLILNNIIFYWKKFLITAVLAGVILFIGASSFIFTSYIKKLADKPLQSLQTEIILQKDSADKNPADVKTAGVILPFNLESFLRNDVKDKILGLPNIKNISTALILWQFDVKNNRTIVALDINEPRVGLRNMDTFLMPGGHFFSANDSSEVILERHFATLFGHKVGQNYPINGKDYKIIGLVDFQEQSNLANAQIFIPYKTALQIIGKKDEIANQVFVSLQSAAKLDSTKNQLTKEFPDLSILSKDNLLKNLSGLNQMFYRFGAYFEAGMALISLLLVIFVIKLRRLEYDYQSVIFKFLGWPKNKIVWWNAFDSLLTLFNSFIFAAVLSLLLWWQMPSIVNLGPLMNYNLLL